eukprot:1731702-Pyramimonas_sp.AAC.1
MRAHTPPRPTCGCAAQIGSRGGRDRGAPRGPPQPLWLTGCGSAGPALQLGRRRPRGMGTL